MSFMGTWPTNVQVGDLLAFSFWVENYLLRDGQKEWNPADLMVPQGWTLIDWWTPIRGGDPRRIALVGGIVARVADAATAAAPLSGAQGIASAVPYYAADQDPGSGRVGLNAQQLVHGGFGFFGHWRGEKGIAAVDVWSSTVAAHEAVLLQGRSRDGGASVARWASWPWGGAGGAPFWRATDNNRPSAENPTRNGNNPLVSTEGLAGSLYAWSTIGGSMLVPTIGMVTMHALSVTDKSYPLQPVITSPAPNALLDLESAGVTISWRHRPSLAGPQAGWALTRTLGSNTRWWNAAGGSWSATLVRNPGMLASADLPASAFVGATGLEHTFALQTHGANLELSMPSRVSVTAVLGPVATASFVGVDLAGSLASLRPQVAISGTSPAGLALTGWSASLVDVAAGRELAAGAGSFDGASSATWAPGVEVVNGARVQAMVRVQQVGGAWSPPVTVEATTDVDLPGAPTLAVTMGTHPTSGAPSARVRVEFPWQTDGYPWSSRPTVLRLDRLDGGEWVTAAEITLGPGRTSAVLDDFAAGAGALQYRGRGEGQAADGSRLLGGWGLSAPTVSVVPGGWLIDPAEPETAVRVDLVSDESRTVDLRSVRMAAIGRAEELVAAGTPLLESGQLTLRVHNPDHRGRVLALLESGAVLKVTFCPERDVFDGGREAAGESLWFRPVGDVSTSRVVDRGPWALRHVQFAFVTQRPPVRRATEVA